MMEDSIKDIVLTYIYLHRLSREKLLSITQEARVMSGTRPSSIRREVIHEGRWSSRISS